MINALIVGGFVGGIAGYIGSLMLSKRMALMGGALGHLTLPGISLALLYNFDVSIGAIIFLTFGILLIWILEKKTKLPLEALTATVFASSISIAFLFLPKEEALIALIGDVSQISTFAVIITISTSLIVFFISKYIYSKVILMNISEDLAQSIGINTSIYNLIYLTCIALTVGVGVRVVGGLMTAALVAIPASTSKNISNNLFQYSYISAVLGILSCIVGIAGSMIIGFPAGPLIIISSTFFFLISIFFR